MVVPVTTRSRAVQAMTALLVAQVTTASLAPQAMTGLMRVQVTTLFTLAPAHMVQVARPRLSNSVAVPTPFSLPPALTLPGHL